MLKRFQQEAAAMQEQLSLQRRHFHMHPELSFQEFKTSASIKARLEELGIELQAGITPPNLVGIIRGGKAGKTIALRADMDALPIEEENDVPYRSQNKGVMHACGHDAHTAMLLGAAELLMAHREALCGTVKLFFQHAEELPPGGALKMIEEGALLNPKVDMIFGQHVQPSVKLGTFAVKEGAFMAATDTFELVIRGKGGHGGYFHQATDVIVIAAQLITAIQTIASRKLSPFAPVALSVCKLQGGSTHNVLPDEVLLGGTIRSYDAEVRNQLVSEFERMAEHITAMNGAQFELSITPGYPVLINDAQALAFGRTVAEQLVGQANIVEHPQPFMGGEDFARYLQQVPGAFFDIGAGHPDTVKMPPLHNCRFDIDEQVLPLGTAFLASLAYSYLNEGL